MKSQSQNQSMCRLPSSANSICDADVVLQILLRQLQQEVSIHAAVHKVTRIFSESDLNGGTDLSFILHFHIQTLLKLSFALAEAIPV
jgi:hypothetical protein